MKLEFLVAICLLDYCAKSHCPNHERHPRPFEDHTKVVQMARYIMRVSDFASVATLSTLPLITDVPFANLKSVVDGTIIKSTGIPYFYLSPLDITARDLKRNSSCTVLLFLEDDGLCEKKIVDEYDDDPRCSRLILSGRMKRVKEKTREFTFAKAALFEKHPAMASYPKTHRWFVAKLNIAQIALADWVGRAKFLRVKDYLNYRYPGNAVIEKYLMPLSVKKQTTTLSNTIYPTTTARHTTHPTTRTSPTTTTTQTAPTTTTTTTTPKTKTIKEKSYKSHPQTTQRSMYTQPHYPRQEPPKDEKACKHFRPPTKSDVVSVKPKPYNFDDHLDPAFFDDWELNSSAYEEDI